MPANDVIALARAEIGVMEDPAGSNRQKYGEWYGMNGQPWCVMFLAWCLYYAGERSAFMAGAKTASCGTLLRWYRAEGRTVPAEQIQPGDIVILNFSGTSETQHCGLVVDALKMGYFQTIEGNTSQSGSQSNGGQVCLKTRNLSQVVGVCRPRYSPKPPETDYDDHWAGKDIRWCLERGLLTGYPDGSFKPEQPVTRAEMAVIIRRICEYKGDHK